MNKRAQIIEGGIVLIILVIVIAAIAAYFRATDYECRSNADCDSDSYCSANRCEEIPVKEIVKQPVIIERDYRSLSGPAFVLGMFILIAAVILRFKGSGKEKTVEVQKKLPEIKSGAIRFDEKKSVKKKAEGVDLGFNVKNLLLTFVVIGLIVIILMFLIFL